MKTEFILVVIKLNQPPTDSPAQRRFWLCPFLATGLKWTAEESVQGSASNQEQPAEFLPGEMWRKHKKEQKKVKLNYIGWGDEWQWGNESIKVQQINIDLPWCTCSLFSLSRLRMSSTNSRALSRSCLNFCQYRSSSLAAHSFSSGSF